MVGFLSVVGGWNIPLIVTIALPVVIPVVLTPDIVVVNVWPIPVNSDEISSKMAFDL